MKLFEIIILMALTLVKGADSAQVVTGLDHTACEEFKLAKELKVYKDPSIFVGSLGQMYSDPHQGWSSLLNESPILTTLEGMVHLMKLSAPVEFKNFGMISRLYEFADPRFKMVNKKVDGKNERSDKYPLVVPIKICGTSYSDSLGFVFVSDLNKSIQEDLDPTVMPPSVYPNPVPSLKLP